MIKRLLTIITLMAAWVLSVAAPPAPRQRRKPSKRGPRSPGAGKWPDWVGLWPRLTGRQEPEFESRHPGDESEGDDAAVFGARIGLRCMPWQWQMMRAIHSRQKINEWGERLWTHRDVCVEATRQQGKTLGIVLIILWRMAKHADRVIYTAQRGSTARDVWDRTITVIARVPSLRRRLLAKPTWTNSRGDILFRNGAKCEFGPRSQDFGRGYTEVDLLIIDEAYDVDAGQEANLTGAQSAAANPQTIYMSTPPVLDIHPNCQTLSDLHRLGHDRAPDLFYALFAAPADSLRDDPAAWALAQPSYGVATNEREIRSKRQKAKTSAKQAIFDADYMGWGVYAPDEADGGSALDLDVWDQRVDPYPVLVGDFVIAVDREYRGRRRWAIACGRRTEDGRVFAEVGFWRAAMIGDVAAYLVGLVELWDPAAVLVDARSAAAGLGPYVKELGIEMEVTSTNFMALACKGFEDAVEGDDIAHGGQPVMVDAIESATKRDLPRGDFAWDGATIAPLVAMTLVYLGVLEYASERGPMASPSVGAPAPEYGHRGRGDVTDLAAFDGFGVDLDALDARF